MEKAARFKVGDSVSVILSAQLTGAGGVGVRAQVFALTEKAVQLRARLTVWQSADGSVIRVYGDWFGENKKGRDAIKACYHVTGDNRNPPGALTDEGPKAFSLKKQDAAFIEIAKAAARDLAPGERIDVKTAAATKYPSLERPEPLRSMLADLVQKRLDDERSAKRRMHKEAAENAALAAVLLEDAALQAALEAAPQRTALRSPRSLGHWRIDLDLAKLIEQPVFAAALLEIDRRAAAALAEYDANEASA